MKQDLDLGVRLIGMANSQLSFKRKMQLKSYIAPGFARLCNESTPLTQWMFGGDVKGLIEKTMKINQMVRRAHGNYRRGRGFQGPFLGRGRGGFRGGFSKGGNTYFKGGGRGFRRGRARGGHSSHRGQSSHQSQNQPQTS